MRGVCGFVCAVCWSCVCGGAVGARHSPPVEGWQAKPDGVVAHSSKPCLRQASALSLNPLQEVGEGIPHGCKLGVCGAKVLIPFRKSGREFRKKNKKLKEEFGLNPLQEVGEGIPFGASVESLGSQGLNPLQEVGEGIPGSNLTPYRTSLNPLQEVGEGIPLLKSHGTTV